MKLSVIVTTYNWPKALHAVLQSLVSQSRLPDEVIIADDGSGPETRELIESFEAPFPIVHAWHADDGFQAGAARNNALAKVSGDWIVMLDGDCVCPPRFLERHLRLASPGYLVAGNRRLLTQSQTELYLESGQSAKEFIDQAGAGKNRYVPLGLLRDLRPKQWSLVRTCNLGISTNDALHLQGFDEAYRGWGKEDSDFAVRAVNAGLKIRMGQLACTVLHLYHAEADRAQLPVNIARLEQVLASNDYLPRASRLKD